ncbi:MAG: sulfatase-like hydrolase/transferase [Chitinivibrionales bacterium]|nr:sulfatase-like hydrolase/transferase [Chitinivibrionales bacterium]
MPFHVETSDNSSRALTRRRFMTLAGGGASFALANSLMSCNDDPSEPKRPNILLALADDWSWPYTSLKGMSSIVTPNFDRLAKEGVLFENAFASSPSCSPSRAAILTGRNFWELEQGANLWGTLPDTYRVYPDILESAGYHVGFSDKGWGPGRVAPGGRRRNPAGPKYNDFKSFLLARPKGTPFCFWFGSHDPHRFYGVKARVNTRLTCDDIVVPDCLPDHPIVRRDLCNHRFEVNRFDRDLGKHLKLLDKAGELDNTMVIVTGDNGMPFPRHKATVYDGGVHVPLAIWFGDNIARGATVSDFVNLCDLAPTILNVCGIDISEKMSGRSLMPVLRSPDTGHRSHVVVGRERHTCAQANTKKGYPVRAIRTHDYLYIFNFEPDRWPLGTPEAFRDADRSPTKKYLLANRNEPGIKNLFQLIFGKKPQKELYDLKRDPAQLNNVADQAQYEHVSKRLHEKLFAYLEETGDPRVSGSGGVFDSYKFYMLRRISQ